MTTPANTSATGGVLQPTVKTPPLEGADLQVFVQNFIAPLTTLDPTLVRPRWQPEPANIPTAGDAWCALGPGDRASDTYPFVGQTKDGYQLQRHEQFPVLCSFYDLGSTGLADYYASLTRDNLAIPQNREALYGTGWALAFVEGLRVAPTLKMTRWLMRIDLPITFRRQVTRNYDVLSVESAQVTVTTDTGLSEEIVVNAGD